MQNSQAASIRKEILARYGSLEMPDFHFQSAVPADRPYRLFVDELMPHVFLREVTDVNQDVCFVYAADDDSGAEWMLQLSMVGRYGVLFRLAEGGLLLLEPEDPDATGRESLIRRLMRKHSIAQLGEQVLLEPIGLKLFYTEPENVRIYQALFSDTDILPWRTSK